MLYQALKRISGASKAGVMAYRDLQTVTILSGWQRHHIFEKRFTPTFQKRWPRMTDGDILAIPIPVSDPRYADYHNMVTQKMRNKIPYSSDPTYYTNLNPDDVINAHIQTYYELIVL